MDLVYSSHAKKRIRERGIEECEIEHIIKYPSYIKRRNDGKIEANAKIKNRFLKVVYIRLQKYIKVITLF